MTTTPTLLSDAELKEIEAHCADIERTIAGIGPGFQVSIHAKPTQWRIYVAALRAVAALTAAPSEGEAKTWLDELARRPDDDFLKLAPGACDEIASLLRRQAASIVRLKGERDEARDLAGLAYDYADNYAPPFTAESELWREVRDRINAIPWTGKRRWQKG